MAVCARRFIIQSKNDQKIYVLNTMQASIVERVIYFVFDPCQRSAHDQSLDALSQSVSLRLDKVSAKSFALSKLNTNATSIVRFFPGFDWERE